MLKHLYRNCTDGGSSHLLADVLSSERAAARTTFETTDMPLSLQRQQRLTLFDLLAAACTVWRRGDRNTTVREHTRKTGAA